MAMGLEGPAGTLSLAISLPGRRATVGSPTASSWTPTSRPWRATSEAERGSRVSLRAVYASAPAVLCHAQSTGRVRMVDGDRRAAAPIRDERAKAGGEGAFAQARQHRSSQMPRRMGALPGKACCPYAAPSAFRQARSRASSARPSGHSSRFRGRGVCTPWASCGRRGCPAPARHRT